MRSNKNKPNLSQLTKKQLRERILSLLRNQKEEDRLAKSEAISHKLFADKGFQQSQAVLFYASFDGEVDTFAMIRKALDIGKRICLPKVVRRQNRILPIRVENLDHDLKRGTYGIYEPKLRKEAVLSPDALDTVIVPGLAFDQHNHRLGRGGGYYDRFLAMLNLQIRTIGLAFDFQIIDQLPGKESHDQPVSCVLTN
jgi:5-formyltetrahydrofolate cyclo-ligase